MPHKKNNSKQTKVSAERNGDKPQNAYILQFGLEDIRCFGERQEIDFLGSDNNPNLLTIILGDNGTGKTTILQNLLLNFLIQKTIYSLETVTSESNIEAAKLETFLSTIQATERSAGIVNQIIKTVESSGEKLEINQRKLNNAKNFIEEIAPRLINVHFQGKQPKSFISLSSNVLKNNCFAYGASRKAGETSLSEQNEESSYITLFNETALLINPEEWLLQADYFVSRSSAKKSKEKFKQVKEILISVLPDVDDIRINEKNNEERSFPIPVVEFHTHYGWVESKDLSLGYRTSMAWVVDFVSRMFDLYPESENSLAEPAVVLIDEIDLHLHPKWQRELIDYLTNLFPNTQFIVTTHSPLIVQAAAARDANIVVCRREGDHVVIDQSVEAVKNWRTDQILTSDLFDLPTARPKKVEPFLEERQKILSKAKLTKRDEKRLAELEEKIGFMPAGENHEDNEAMEIIRNAADWLKTQSK